MISLEEALQTALQHHQSGRLGQAESIYAAILGQAPWYADAWHLAGVCSHQMGDHAMAVVRIKNAIVLNNQNPGYYNNLGIALKALNQVDEAIVACRQALQLQPDNAAAYVTLGNIMKEAGSLEQAAANYRQALQYRPELAECHNNLANVLKNLGQYADAVAHYQYALRLKPNLPELHHNLGNALLEQGKLDAAIASYRAALQHKPDYRDALLHLGHGLKARGEAANALICYQQAQNLYPDDSEIRCALIGQLQALCQWDGLDDLLAAQQRAVQNPASAPIAPFAFLCTPSTSEEQQDCAKKWSAHDYAPFVKMRRELAFSFARKSGPKLRIGYLSADFQEHATAYLMAELMELHDRERFEVVAYSYGQDDGGPMRKRLASACERFVDLRNTSTIDSARMIHADRIDILIDLKGYTRHARSEILALRPAPIQAHYLGYPGTMGSDFIDYFFTDPIVSPPSQAPHFTEKMVYLPECYQINDRQRSIAEPTPSRQACGLPAQGMVFCCLNNPYKITQEIFEVWMRLLLAVPDSVLWLLQGDAQQAENLYREAGRRGVAAARLIFAPKLPLAQHLARYRVADLFLDTLPVNAHTTASDALWAGLPLLSCSGETFVARVAASLLHNAGLPELAVSNIADYEAMALRLARHPDELADLRTRLAANRLSCPLFDSKRFTRHLESAYELMWQNHLAGTPAQAIHVPSI